ncbi:MULTISPECIES: ABC transporter substrate-binding protein [Paraburkholderia]|uniref:ABC transport system substrate-binding protein n=1 Tax=Paraburkholderia silvatlantica TaxID=321895 RepID=A0A2U1ABI0_9BURK|nr:MULTISPECIES: ABC transporter substrate-binding protein [Paraburkholderia]MBB2930307.1 putative ABC transport system substrate-binding protein [Paraburkholderia silvatlantica]PVY32137.1 putative ABC transport system substrate-binding protein [Paraburkholderia silvatlantica]PXW37757.1 putative ABC transport system substrate-binding protein [Paraburkholderia silvatlantica]PYE25578.1 putative ABC transport system substrate-binding protein [Paraburkholderia silvatlantica]TDQ97779.1 putative ABC
MKLLSECVQRFGKRRGMATALLSMALGLGTILPTATHAQTVSPAPIVVGIANFGPHPALSRTIQGFKDEMQAHGYVENKTVRYVYSDANFTPSLIPQTLAQIVAQHPSVILTITTPVAQAAVRNVSDTGTPLVFSQVTDPVKAGIVPDWQHGSARINGTSSVTDYNAVLDFAKKVFPMAKKFGVLYNSGEVNDVAAIASLKEAAAKAGLDMVATSADSSVDVPQRAGTLQGIDFFYAIGSSLVQSSLPAVASVTDHMHVPILSAEHELIRKGDIIAVAYAPSYESQGAHAADMALQMIKGVKPSAMPVYRAVPADYKALINRRKMAALNLPIPAALDACNCFVN